MFFFKLIEYNGLKILVNENPLKISPFFATLLSSKRNYFIFSLFSNYQLNR